MFVAISATGIARMKSPMVTARIIAKQSPFRHGRGTSLDSHRRYGAIPLSTIGMTVIMALDHVEDTLRMTLTKRRPATFAGLRRIIATLRGPQGCPWDKVQTHQSLAPYLLEETHETLEALESADPEKLCEELGDLLFEVLIQAQLAEEAGEFTMRDVIDGVSDKLIRRHPHIFGDAVADTPDAVIEQWDDLKARERAGESALTGIPLSLPALVQAQAIQRRAVRAGFAFESLDQVWQALKEELEELREAQTPEEKRQEL